MIILHVPDFSKIPAQFTFKETSNCVWCYLQNKILRILVA